MPLFIRNSLVRSALDKTKFDYAFDHNFDPAVWYRVSLPDVSDDTLRLSFVQSHFDDATSEFVEHSRRVTDAVCMQLFYSFTSFFLQYAMTKTSINGLLGRGSMFLFSVDQLDALLNTCYANRAGFCTTNSQPTTSDSINRLLDLGSGDGAITSVLAGNGRFQEVDCTEMSKPMIWRLRDHGFNIVDVETWAESPKHYSMISALNLIDRHYAPISLLRKIQQFALKKNALFLLGVVFPWSQFVEFNSNSSSQPVEWIEMESKSVEGQLSEFVKTILTPVGFRVQKWTRVPYLCEGDMHQSFYVLNNILFLLVPV